VVADYLYRHPEIKELIIEVQSPGGSVMEAWRCVGLFDEMRAHGIAIETRCYGYAASAGGIILIAGDIGNRFVGPHSEIMIHKVWTFSMFDVSDPDTSEDKAKILKHFQANINEFFKERTKLTHDIINEKTNYKQWWLTGTEAVEWGVADHLISE
jgi:ATP-dependent Clp protease protease subunit